jgi:rare lipoprotein A
MKKLVIGCAVAGLITLLPKFEARPSVLPRPLPMVNQVCSGEVGVASWYGIERQGKPTASGEVFDKDRLTAAHRKLPLGTTVRVTNIRNLKSTILKVNDRGPGINGRVIDVSWAAANKLGFLEAGLTRVQIDILNYPKSAARQAAISRTPKVN